MGLDLQHVREIAERVAAGYGLEIWDVELRGTGGKSRMLRVYIDRPSGAKAPGSRAEGGAVATRVGAEAPTYQAAPFQGTTGGLAVGGVTHEDCANVSRELGTILDVEDAVPGGQYLLEVSSPGLDRRLWRPADFERFVGSRVKLMTREPMGGNRHFEGRLERCGEGKLVLNLEMQNAKGKRQKGAGKQSSGRRDAGATRATAEGGCATQVEIELSNVERANLVPEF